MPTSKTKYYSTTTRTPALYVDSAAATLGHLSPIAYCTKLECVHMNEFMKHNLNIALYVDQQRLRSKEDKHHHRHPLDDRQVIFWVKPSRQRPYLQVTCNAIRFFFISDVNRMVYICICTSAIAAQKHDERMHTTSHENKTPP